MSINGLVFRALDLIADVSSPDLSRSTSDLLADSIDELEAGFAGNRDAFIIDESCASWALIGCDDSFGCHGLYAITIDLLESRGAAKNNNCFSFFADKTILLPSGRTVLDAFDVLVVVITSWAGDGGNRFSRCASRSLSSALGSDGGLPVDGFPRLFVCCSFSGVCLMAAGAFGACLRVLMVG